MCAYWEGGTSTDMFARAKRESLNTKNSNEVTKRTHHHRAGHASEVSGQCQVAVCECCESNYAVCIRERLGLPTDRRKL